MVDWQQKGQNRAIWPPSTKIGLCPTKHGNYLGIFHSACFSKKGFFEGGVHLARWVSGEGGRGRPARSSDGRPREERRGIPRSSADASARISDPPARVRRGPEPDFRISWRGVRAVAANPAEKSAAGDRRSRGGAPKAGKRLAVDAPRGIERGQEIQR